MLTSEILLANASGKSRRAWHEGREYIVAPMTTIVPGVLNGSKGSLYYPVDEISRNHNDWNDRPITLYHPTDPLTGEHLSADHDGVRERQGIGFLRNTTARGKLKHEGWFDVERTRKLDNRVYESLVKNRPMELSTGLYTDNEPAPPGSHFRGRPYSFIARNYRPDHLAVLPDQRGACSVADGCGVLVNGTLIHNWSPVINAGTAQAGAQQRGPGGRFGSGGRAATGSATASGSATEPAEEGRQDAAPDSAPEALEDPNKAEGPVDPLTGDPLYKGGGKTHNARAQRIVEDQVANDCHCGGTCKKCSEVNNEGEDMETGDSGGGDEGGSMETNDDYGITPQVGSGQSQPGSSSPAGSMPRRPPKPIKASAAGSAEAVSKAQGQRDKQIPTAPRPPAANYSFNAEQVKMPGKKAPKQVEEFEDASEELHEDDAPAMLVGKQRGNGRNLGDLGQVTEDPIGGAEDDHNNPGIGHMATKTKKSSSTLNEFASDDQRRAFFGHMGAGGGGAKSSEARTASEHANSTKSKSAHLAAAKSHRDAAAHHSEKADYAETKKEQGHHEELAAGHASAAKFHSAKAGKSIRNQRAQQGTIMTRSEFINMLIANGEATESDRPSLKAMELTTLNALFKKRRDDEEDEDEDDEDDDDLENNDDSNVHSFDGKGATKAGSMQAGGEGTKDEYNKRGVKNQLTVREWEQMMPPEARAVWNTVKEAETNLKLGLVHRIIVNIQDPKRRNLVGNRLMKLGKEQLEEQLELVGSDRSPASRGVRNADSEARTPALFFGDAPVTNGGSGIDKTAVLAMPTLNYGEIASPALIEKLKKRA